MRRAWVVLGIATMALVAGPLGAQSRRIRLGATAGLNFAKWSGDDAGGAKRRTAFHGGLTVSTDLSPAFSLYSGAIYSQEGTGVDVSGANVSLKADYIEVPLELRAGTTLQGQTPIRPYLTAGAAVGFKTRCRAAASGGGTSVEVDCTDPSLALKLKGTDFGLRFGAGVEIGRASLGGRYQLGLTKVVDDSSNPDVKNSVVAITAGFRF